MDQNTLRSWWWRKQALDGRLKGQMYADILIETGWLRSVGGVAPYLGLFARGGFSREAIDAGAAALNIHELPAVRGCTYVVPEPDFALALRAAQAFADTNMSAARKLGVTDKEIEKLCVAIESALKDGPLGPDGIRDRVGKAARNLGAEGAKKGVTTTLPIALRRMQTEGTIRRVPTNGRLDQQRYKYTLWRIEPAKLSVEEVNFELARRYFRWTGPASLKEFQWFSGLGAGAAKNAMAELKLATFGEDRFILPEDLDALNAFKAPIHPEYALVASIDGISLLRRDLAGLVDAADMKLVSSEKNALQDLPSHGIFDRGRLVGLWEYDVDTASLVWTAFVPRDKALIQAVAQTEAFVRDELGDARSFSLDSPKSRAPRIKALRAAG